MSQELGCASRRSDQRPSCPTARAEQGWGATGLLPGDRWWDTKPSLCPENVTLWSSFAADMGSCILNQTAHKLGLSCHCLF